MKIVLGSDIHLEFAPLDFEEITFPDGDLFVLAGDIVSLGRMQKEQMSVTMPSTIPQDFETRLRDLLYHAYQKYGKDRVIYIAGNHEHYGSNDFTTTAKQINEILCEQFGVPDVKHIPEKIFDTVEIDNKVIAFGTMFTCFDHSPFYSMEAENCMNDYRQCRFEKFRSLKAADVFEVNQRFHYELKKCQPDIVITHHAPTRKHILGKYSHGVGALEHAYFCTDAEKFVERYDNTTKLWLSGHTHQPVDFEMNGTQFFSNPRGYDGYEDLADTFEFKVIEVD